MGAWHGGLLLLQCAAVELWSRPRTRRVILRRRRVPLWNWTRAPVPRTASEPAAAHTQVRTPLAALFMPPAQRRHFSDLLLARGRSGPRFRPTVQGRKTKQPGAGEKGERARFRYW